MRLLGLWLLRCDVAVTCCSQCDQLPSAGWALVHTGAAESQQSVENVRSVVKETNLDPSELFPFKSREEPEDAEFSNNTNYIMCPHQRQQQQVFLLLFDRHVPGHDSTVCVIVQHSSWLGNLKGRLSCGFRSNVDHDVQLKALNVLSHTGATLPGTGQAQQQQKPNPGDWVLTWRQLCCWGNLWCSVACPGCPVCCHVALQVDLCVRLSPNVSAPDVKLV